MSRHICVIAGEPSGDFLGGKLIEALRVADPELRFSGVGGYYMRMAGMESLFGYEQLAVMGVTEVLPKLPQLLARIRQTIDHIKETKPDVVVKVDSPDFSFRVAKALRREMQKPPKIIHYVAPTVWAWREGRAAKISKFLDGLICLFDFEPPYFEKHGLRTVTAGHPMVEGEAMKADGARFRDEYGILQGDTIIGALFGSRRGEVKRTGPAIRDALFRLAGRMEILPYSFSARVLGFLSIYCKPGPALAHEMLLRLEAGLVAHLLRTLDPVAEIDMRQAEGLCAADMVEHHHRAE